MIPSPVDETDYVWPAVAVRLSRFRATEIRDLWLDGRVGTAVVRGHRLVDLRDVMALSAVARPVEYPDAD